MRRSMGVKYTTEMNTRVHCFLAHIPSAHQAPHAGHSWTDETYDETRMWKSTSSHFCYTAFSASPSFVLQGTNLLLMCNDDDDGGTTTTTTTTTTATFQVVQPCRHTMHDMCIKIRVWCAEHRVAATAVGRCCWLLLQFTLPYTCAIQCKRLYAQQNCRIVFNYDCLCCIFLLLWYPAVHRLYGTQL